MILDWDHRGQHANYVFAGVYGHKCRNCTNQRFPITVSILSFVT